MGYGMGYVEQEGEGDYREGRSQAWNLYMKDEECKIKVVGFNPYK